MVRGFMVSEDHGEWGQAKVSTRPGSNHLKTMLVLLIVPPYSSFFMDIGGMWRKQNRKKFVTVKNWLSWSLNMVSEPTCLRLPYTASQ